MSYEEKSGQLIECINPEHLYLGSIHYIQPDCVSKLRAKYLANSSENTYWAWANDGEIGTIGTVQVDAVSIVKYWAPDNDPSRFDSDESWQASEALLKRG